MTRKRILRGVFSFCLSTVLLLLFTVPFATAQRHLKMQFLHGAGETFVPHEEFVEKVRVATGGRLVIDAFPSGAIVPTGQMAQAVSQGTLDMAFTYGGYHPGFVDVANIECGLPMSWSHLDEAFQFYYVYGFEKLVREAYAERNIYWMLPVPEAPLLLATKKPVHSIDDMKPMKIRATAPVGAVLKEFGIATVYLPSEEMYTSLATGVIDGVIYGSYFHYAKLKFQEQAPYVTDLGLVNPLMSAVIINKKVFDNLPADLKEILKNAVEAKYSAIYYGWKMQVDAKFKNVFKNEPFAAEDIAKLTKAAQKTWEVEAKKSPRAAKAIEMLKTLAKDTGRL
jgi:TRAP-type C4-dicarboxylate transport system substrate-binding protein